MKFTGTAPLARGRCGLEALRIALTGVSTNRLSVADFGRVSADNEAFTGWVDKMKVRFRTRPAPIGAGKPVAPPAKPNLEQAELGSRLGEKMQGDRGDHLAAVALPADRRAPGCRCRTAGARPCRAARGW